MCMICDCREGSSPLARGGQVTVWGNSHYARLIPARAGRTPATAPRAPAAPAHPRSRGADSRAAGDGGTGPGLIPARAGRTTCRLARSFCPPAHPRSRGADFLPLPDPADPAGSSPLARGGPGTAPTPRAPCRLIPARAGRTLLLFLQVPGGAAHPRSRGADLAEFGADGFVNGSSPLARGGRRDHAGADDAPGLIPARAGRTRRWGAPAAPVWAHPRSRGADAGSSPLSSILIGSSPLARGGRWPTLGSCQWMRLIPARAGRTTATPATSCSTPAHPRSRGADSRPVAEEGAGRGSSPLARGGPRLP